jgi:hypothetical protein
MPYLGGLAAKARRGEAGASEASFIAHRQILPLLAGARSYRRDVMQKLAVLRTLVERLRRDGRRIVIYGANTQTLEYLLSGAIQEEQIEYMVDDDSYKQGCYLAGTHLPVYSTHKLFETPVDAVVISAYFSQDKMVAAFRDQLGPQTAIIKFYPEPEIVGST